MAEYIGTRDAAPAHRSKPSQCERVEGRNQHVLLHVAATYDIQGLPAELGIPLAVLLSYWMFRTSSSAAAKFTLNLPMYLLALAVLFALLVITMVYSVRKLKDDSIVETLKSEIS